MIIADEGTQYKGGLFVRLGYGKAIVGLALGSNLKRNTKYLITEISDFCSVFNYIYKNKRVNPY